MRFNPNDSQYSVLLESFNDGAYTDLTCGDITFEVHKSIICTASSFFRNACRFPGKEASDGRVDLPDDDPEMIRRMIIHLYILDYDPTTDYWIGRLGLIKHHIGSVAPAAARGYHDRYSVSSINPEKPWLESNLDCACISPLAPGTKVHPTLLGRSLDIPSNVPVLLLKNRGYQVANPLTIHASMYALADKYDIPTLATRSREKFESCLSSHWDSKDFVDAVATIYKSTPESNRGLRDVVVAAFRKYVNVDITQIQGIEEELGNFNILAFKLIKSLPKLG